jgi:DNA mismatch repair ATPase MutL
VLRPRHKLHHTRLLSMMPCPTPRWRSRGKASCCSLKVRAGRRLKAQEMDALLREMEVIPNSGQCNHGRPTYVELELTDIERLFGRR